MSIADNDSPIETVEEFHLAVVADNVLDADREVWATFEKFLGRDTVEAWRLREVEHHPQVDGEGRLTGKLETTAIFQRDPNVPTPPNMPVIIPGIALDSEEGE